MIVWRASHMMILMAGLFALPCVSALAADVPRGKMIAARWCSACHVVASDQKNASADVPSFADIALRRSDAKKLGNFLVDPHPKMPDLHLTRSEIDDIVAYIRSLDPRPAPPREPDGEKREKPTNG